MLQLLVTANVIPSLLTIFTLKMKATCSSETLVLTRATQRHIPKDGIFSHLILSQYFMEPKSPLPHVRFEVFTAVTMKNDVFWDVTPCGSCKNQRFRGT
jgi:hypothetical protein